MLMMVTIPFSSIKTKRRANVFAVDLPGHFYVWLVSPQASFLRGKFVWANWDVDELVGLKDKISNEGLIDIDMRGGSL